MQLHARAFKQLASRRSHRLGRAGVVGRIRPRGVHILTSAVRRDAQPPDKTHIPEASCERQSGLLAEHIVNLLCTSSHVPACNCMSDIRCLKMCAMAHTQVSEEAPAYGSIQPSITNLLRLAQLHVWGSPQFAMRLPPGFGGLSAITSLILCTVGHQLSTQRYPRQSVVDIVYLSPELMASADDRTAASPAHHSFYRCLPALRVSLITLATACKIVFYAGAFLRRFAAPGWTGCAEGARGGWLHGPPAHRLRPASTAGKPPRAAACHYMPVSCMVNCSWCQGAGSVASDNRKH